MSLESQNEGHLKDGSKMGHLDRTNVFESAIFFMWAGFSNPRSGVWRYMGLNCSKQVHLDQIKLFIWFWGRIIAHKDFWVTGQKWAQMENKTRVMSILFSRRVDESQWKSRGNIIVGILHLHKIMVEIGTIISRSSPLTDLMDVDFQFFWPPWVNF